MNNCITFPIFVFKRFYSITPKQSKIPKQYKLEYELTREQKEALVGIMFKSPVSSKRIFKSLTLFKLMSKPLTHYRLYSTALNNKKSLSLDGNFIAGFIDAEGSFRVRVSKSNERKTGWMVEPVLQIGLHKKDLALLELIQKAWGGVGSTGSMGKDGVIFRVSSLNVLNEIIIPFFTRYPLLTSKQINFELFKKVVDLMNQKEHLTIEGLKKIVSIKASMNLGLSDELKLAFPEVKAILKPSMNEKKIENPH